MTEKEGHCYNSSLVAWNNESKFNKFSSPKCKDLCLLLHAFYEVNV
jgi:endogenous inhibitor of DNA gyrase (YacG/DUF329 family)